MLLAPLSLVLVTQLSGPGAPVPLDISRPHTPIFRFEQAAPPPPSALTRDHRFRRGPDQFARKAKGACVGAFIGLFAGALLGAALDDGKGDSGDLLGVMIGGEIGAAIGGVVGWRLAGNR